MKLSWVKALGGFFLAAILSAPALAAPSTALPGTLNFVEGQASIGNQPVTSQSVGMAELQAGQTISTENGRAEVLLTPGVFLRLGHNSAVKMISPDITNTVVQLQQGRAEVEVAQIFKQNDIRVLQDDASTQLLKKGLYDFSNGEVRVFKGQAEVIEGARKVKLDQGHELALNAPKLKQASFKVGEDESGLYNWSELRSEYLSEASANAAQSYIAGPGWIGAGWYWDPYFADYTFLPGAGVLYSPFGPWGFYSPGFIYSYGPYLGFGYYGGYGRPFYHGVYPYHFHAVGPRAGAFSGPRFAGGGFHGGGFAAGGFRR